MKNIDFNNRQLSDISNIIKDNIKFEEVRKNYARSLIDNETSKKIEEEVLKYQNDIFENIKEDILNRVNNEIDKGKFTKKFESITKVFKERGYGPEFDNAVNSYITPLVKKELEIIREKLEIVEAEKILSSLSNEEINKIDNKIKEDIDKFTKKEVIKTLLSKVNEENEKVRKEIKENYNNLDKVEVDLKTDSLSEKIEDKLDKDKYSLSLLDSKSEFLLSVDNIPSETGPVSSQQMFVKLEGNNAVIGVVYERNSSNKYLDTEKLIENFMNLAKKNKIKVDKDKFFEKEIIPSYISAYFNSRNKEFKDKILPVIEDISEDKLPELKKWNFSEINLLEKQNSSIKTFPVKFEINKLITFKKNPEREYINEKSIEYIKNSFDILGLELPYKEINNDNNEKIVVVSLLDKKEIKDIKDISVMITDILKNSEEQNKSFLDIKKEEEKTKKLIEKGKIKGESINLNDNYALAVTSKITRKELKLQKDKNKKRGDVGDDR